MPSSSSASRTTPRLTASQRPEDRYTISFIGRATSSDTRSGALMAMVFGSTLGEDARHRTRSSRRWRRARRLQPNQAQYAKMPVAEQPRRRYWRCCCRAGSAPIIRSRIANRLETTPALAIALLRPAAACWRARRRSAPSRSPRRTQATSSRTQRQMESVSQSMASRLPLAMRKIQAFTSAHLRSHPPAWLSENREPAPARRRWRSRRGRPPRSRMKVSLPRLTFLSCAISAISASASASPSWANPAMSCKWVGRPTSAR